MKITKTQTIVAIIVIGVLVIAATLYYGMRESSVTTTVNPPMNTGLTHNQSSTTIPTTSMIDTTGWQTYQNSQYGIGLKYPPGWSLRISSSVNRSNSNIILDKNGYEMTVNMCSEEDCVAAASEQTYDQNATLSSSESVSLNIDGVQAWRPIDPTSSGEDDPTSSWFFFTFLRKATPVGNMDFGDTSKYTPVSAWISNNGTSYKINYQLPSTATASNYDHSIINQMDEIVQTITFTQK